MSGNKSDFIFPFKPSELTSAIQTSKTKTTKKTSKTKATKRSRNWLFTSFKNLEDSHYENLKTKYAQIRFIFGGHEECPSTKRKHIQGWIQFETPQRFTQVLKILPDEDFRICNGTEQHQMNYCSKSGKTFKYGEYKVQGQQTPLNDAYEMLKNGEPMINVAEKHKGLYVRCHSALEKVAKMYRAKTAKLSLEKWARSKNLKDSQQVTVNELLTQNDREVLWITDTEGNAGKSFLAKYLVGTHNAFYVRNGKSSDISYSYNYQELVVFDFTRSQEERINYSIIEAFKDGMLFSPKYESTTKIFEPAKVVVFANFPPNEAELSADRWNIKVL